MAELQVRQLRDQKVHRHESDTPGVQAAALSMPKKCFISNYSGKDAHLPCLVLYPLPIWSTVQGPCWGCWKSIQFCWEAVGRLGAAWWASKEWSLNFKDLLTPI